MSNRRFSNPSLIAPSTNGRWGLKALPAIVLACATAATASAQANKAVSRSTDEGGWPNNDSYFSVISDDGRFIAFQSEASNLSGNDSNGSYDIFRRDIVKGTTDLVSVSTSGYAGNGLSMAPTISGDGRLVVFASSASNLISGDTNGQWDVFVRDMDTETTWRISVYSDGRQGNNRSDSPAITPDGRYIAFHSLVSFDSADTNGGYDVYLHDLNDGRTTLVSTTADGTVGNGDSIWPQISEDARSVVLFSGATNFVSGDTNGWSDVFVKDLLTGTIERVNVSSTGTQANGETIWPYISGDGSAVTFCSKASTLVTGDSNNNWDAFVHTMADGQTTRINVRPDGGQADSYTRSPTSLTGNGRYVAFASLATDLVDGDTNGMQDIFIRDLLNETTQRVDFGYEGDEVNDDCFVPDLTSDGRYLTMTSEARNLDYGFAWYTRNIYVTDLDAALYLTQDDLVRGHNAEFTAFACEPGETVYFVYSTKGLGNGPCPPQLGNLCLDLRDPVKTLGKAVADASGTAALTKKIPGSAPLIDVYTQAVARRGNKGSDSVKSHFVSATIMP